MKIEIPNKKFEGEDLVLSRIALPKRCPVRVEIRDDSLFLYIGPRDWQWDFEDETFVGCGTRMGEDDD